MKRALSIIGLLVFWLAAAPRPAAGQIAQGELIVPQFSVFSVGTTVSAPDRGRTSLGGVGRAAEFRNEFRPGLGRGVATNRSASGTDVRVWVMDFGEMEQSLAGRSAERLPPSGDFAGGVRRYAASPPQANHPSSNETSAKPADLTVDDALTKEAHAADLFKRGQNAESRGKFKVAALYYKSVVSLEVASPAKLAAERLRSLEQKLAGR
jgi:hypothetical protein